MSSIMPFWHLLCEWIFPRKKNKKNQTFFLNMEPTNEDDDIPTQLNPEILFAIRFLEKQLQDKRIDPSNNNFDSDSE